MMKMLTNGQSTFRQNIAPCDGPFLGTTKPRPTIVRMIRTVELNPAIPPPR
jgi:hypothetical protein